MTHKPTPLAIVICEDRAAHPAEAALRTALVERLADWPAVSVRVTPHLYDLKPDGPAIRYLRGLKGDLLVMAWLYPRAAYWLLEANGIRGRRGHSSFFPDEELAAGAPTPRADDEPQRTIWCLDLRPQIELARLLGEIDRIVIERGGPALPAKTVAEAEVDGQARIDEATPQRWYPVIDRGRCKTCMECMNFCLFGVFGLDTAGEVFVEQPDACRNGCPACARICPAGAIMFPAHENQALAGDPSAPAEDLNADLVQLFGPRPAAHLAASERQQHLHVAPTKERKPADDLDELVDKLDKSDL